MDQATLKAYTHAVQAAFGSQQALRIVYVNAQEQISVRFIVPCSPFVVNTDGTMNFKAYSEVIESQAPSTNGIITFRVDRILNLESADFQVENIQEWWGGILGNPNGGTVVFPGPETPLFQGKYPDPTVTTESLAVYQSRGWTTEPQPGFVQKNVVPARPANRVFVSGPSSVRRIQ